MVKTILLIILIFILIKFRNILVAKIAKHITLNAGPLHEQYLFRWAVISPIVISLIIFLFTDHGISKFWDGIDQKTLVDNSKLPLLIAALSPILGSIVSNLHRTVQTDKQIKETGKKNLSDSYITHQKVCLENLNHISNKFECMWRPCTARVEKVDFKINIIHVKMNRIYQLFFPSNNLQVGVVTYKPKDLLEEIESFIGGTVRGILSTEAAEEYFSKIDKYIFERKSYETFIFNGVARYIGKIHKDMFLAEFDSTKVNAINNPIQLLRSTFVRCNRLAVDHYVKFDIESNPLVKIDSLESLISPDKRHVFVDSEYQTLVKAILIHLVDMAVAMGEEKDTYPTLTRIKGLVQLLSRVVMLIRENKGSI